MSMHHVFICIDLLKVVNWKINRGDDQFDIYLISDSCLVGNIHQLLTSNTCLVSSIHQLLTIPLHWIHFRNHLHPTIIHFRDHYNILLLCFVCFIYIILFEEHFIVIYLHHIHVDWMFHDIQYLDIILRQHGQTQVCSSFAAFW